VRRNTKVFIIARDIINSLPKMVACDAQGVIYTLPATGGGNGAALTPQSSDNAMLVVGPGQWCVNHVPVAATQATATKALSNTAHRVAARISASINAVAAQGVQILVLRDGATGVGAILWQQRVGPVLAGDSKNFTWDVEIVGTTGFAMTLEFTTAPAATNFNSVALNGFDASI
jgi:hypothetical protein